jgi:hypothetical protein
MPYVSLLLCAIMFVAWVYGLGPSLVAVAAATLCFIFMIEPLGALVLREATEWRYSF